MTDEMWKYPHKYKFFTDRTNVSLEIYYNHPLIMNISKLFDLAGFIIGYNNHPDSPIPPISINAYFTKYDCVSTYIHNKEVFLLSYLLSSILSSICPHKQACVYDLEFQSYVSPLRYKAIIICEKVIRVLVFPHR